MIPAIRTSPLTRSLICFALLTGLPAVALLAAASNVASGAEKAQELPEAMSLILLPHPGEGKADEKIRVAQERVRSGISLIPSLESLGWAYIGKARESFDSGFYLLARSCATAIEENAAEGEEAAESLLLRGHICNSFHRFEEAETIALKLVEKRGMPLDYLLLGDARMERGKLEEAAEAYQTGVNLRPDLQSFARVGWIRWLIGDLDGAIEATGLAVRSGSRQDPEALAWVLNRLATFQFVAGDLSLAQETNAAALTILPKYPPALLLSGRLSLALGNVDSAVEALRAAAAANPMPDYEWTLFEALTEAGEKEEAARVEIRLRESGARIDPRTMSLFLSTVNDSPGLALKMAEEEFSAREDLFTEDALAWALFRGGRVEEARARMEKAVAGMTEDGRLFLHAACIAEGAGEAEEAGDWLLAADDLAHTLLPSERRILETLRASLSENNPSSIQVVEQGANPNDPKK